MRSPFPTLQRILFILLMLFTWAAWGIGLNAKLKPTGSWLLAWWISVALLFLCSFFVRRVDRTLGLLGWLSILSMLALSVVLPHRTSSPASPSPIAFTGWTNGIVGAMAPTFAKLTTNNAAAIQSWLDAGTNGAVFKVKNEHATPIWIFPIARMYTGETEPLRLQIPLLNAPTGSGILVQPGQTANVQVAVLPNTGRWKLVLVYHEHIWPGSSWFRAFLSSLTGRATRADSMQSDWIEKSDSRLNRPRAACSVSAEAILSADERHRSHRAVQKLAA